MQCFGTRPAWGGGESRRRVRAPVGQGPAGPQPGARAARPWPGVLCGTGDGRAGHPGLPHSPLPCRKRHGGSAGMFCFFFLLLMFMLLGPDLPQQLRARAGKHGCTLCAASWKAAPSKVPERSVLARCFAAEGQACAARWDKQHAGFTEACSNGCWPGCVIWDAAIAFPQQGVTESRAVFSVSKILCSLLSVFALMIISD